MMSSLERQLIADAKESPAVELIESTHLDFCRHVFAWDLKDHVHDHIGLTITFRAVPCICDIREARIGELPYIEVADDQRRNVHKWPSQPNRSEAKFSAQSFERVLLALCGRYRAYRLMAFDVFKREAERTRVDHLPQPQPPFVFAVEHACQVEDSNRSHKYPERRQDISFQLGR